MARVRRPLAQRVVAAVVSHWRGPELARENENLRRFLESQFGATLVPKGSAQGIRGAIYRAVRESTPAGVAVTTTLENQGQRALLVRIEFD